MTSPNDEAAVRRGLAKLMGYKGRSDEAYAQCPHREEAEKHMAGEVGAWFMGERPCADGGNQHRGFRCTRCQIWLCERCPVVFPFHKKEAFG